MRMSATLRTILRAASVTAFATLIGTPLLHAAGSAAVKEKTDPLIQKHRTGTLTIRTQPGATVHVTQLGHEFWFGTALNQSMFSDRANPSDRRSYMETVKTNFNSAVHENALKWQNVARRGPADPGYEMADRMLEWCEENGLRMRGHCIFWAAERYNAPWVKELDNEELRKAMERRAREVTSRYRGRIGEYDLNNEMITNNYFRRRLGTGIVADMARWAKEGDPNATLYVNDYNILSGHRLDDYDRQIQGFLDQGIPIGGIGVQGHPNGPFDLDKVNVALDRLARFNLPIRITEFLMQIDDEEEQRDGLVDFYRTCFAHPAVDGILMWGFWEGRMWRPKAALWRRDWSPKPAALAYHDLVFNEWWTDYEGRADDNGVCELKAFYGHHRVEAGGQTLQVELKQAEGKLSVDVGGTAAAK